MIACSAASILKLVETRRAREHSCTRRQLMADSLHSPMRSGISSKPPATGSSSNLVLGSGGSMAGFQIEQGTGSPFARFAAVAPGSQQQPPHNTTCSWQFVSFQ